MTAAEFASPAPADLPGQPVQAPRRARRHRFAEYNVGHILLLPPVIVSRPSCEQQRTTRVRLRRDCDHCKIKTEEATGRIRDNLLGLPDFKDANPAQRGSKTRITAGPVVSTGGSFFSNRNEYRSASRMTNRSRTGFPGHMETSPRPAHVTAREISYPTAWSASFSAKPGSARPSSASWISARTSPATPVE
jgi:hypothetical protein